MSDPPGRVFVFGKCREDKAPQGEIDAFEQRCLDIELMGKSATRHARSSRYPEAQKDIRDGLEKRL